MPVFPIVVFWPLFMLIEIGLNLEEAISSGANIFELIQVIINYFLGLF
ncbi:MAG: hypothetical protein ACI4XH_02420 [Acutalibacteraceae bacterium]